MFFYSSFSHNFNSRVSPFSFNYKDDNNSRQYIIFKADFCAMLKFQWQPLFYSDINKIGIIVKRRFCSLILYSVKILTQGYHIFLLITKMIINYNYITLKKKEINKNRYWPVNPWGASVKSMMLPLGGEQVHPARRPGQSSVRAPSAQASNRGWLLASRKWRICSANYSLNPSCPLLLLQHVQLYICMLKAPLLQYIANLTSTVIHSVF